MKRSRQVILVLSGALASGGLTGCQQEPPPPVADAENTRTNVNPENTYTNDHYVPNLGYYHAPYRSWYPFPYNYYDPAQGYYYGGRWNRQRDQSTVTTSRPTPEAANLVNAKAAPSRASAPSKSSSSSTTSRGGFGRSWSSSGS